MMLVVGSEGRQVVVDVAGSLARLRAGGPELDQLWARHGVRAVVLFGSAAASPDTAGDLDLAVDHDGTLDVMALVRELTALLEFADLDVLDLRTAGPVAAFEALRAPDVIYERGDADLAQRCALAGVRYADTAHLRAQRLRSLAS